MSLITTEGVLVDLLCTKAGFHLISVYKCGICWGKNGSYFVPKLWAVAVGSKTKFAQKQKKIPQTQTANRGFPPNSTSRKVKKNPPRAMLTTPMHNLQIKKELF